MRKKYLLLLPLVIFAMVFLTKLTLAAIPIEPDDNGGRAISSTSPRDGSLKWHPPSNGYPGGGTMDGDETPYYVVGNSKTYAESAKINIYAATGSTVKISVNNAGAGCQNTGPAGGAAGGPDFNDDDGSSNGPRTQFYMIGASFITPIQTKDGSDGCDNISFTYVVSDDHSWPIQDSQGKDTSYNGKNRYVTLVASAPVGGARGENSFTVVSTSEEIGASNAITGYGFRDNSVADGNRWTSEVIFGVLISCNNLHQTPITSIGYKDTDVGKYDNPNLKLELQARAWNSTGSWDTIVDDFTPAQEDTFSTPNGKFSSDFKYRLLIKNVGSRNTIFVQLGPGLSQIAGRYHMADDNCGSNNNNCTPSNPCPLPGDIASCSITMSHANLQDPNSPVTLTVTAKNVGQSAWNPTEYTLRRVSPNGPKTLTASGFVGNGGTVVGTDNITSPGPGNTTTYTYAMYRGNSSFPQSCPKEVQSKQNVGANSCQAFAVNGQTTLPAWNGNAATEAASIGHIKTTLHNGNYDPYFPGGVNGFRMRQIKVTVNGVTSPGGGNRQLSKNVYPGTNDNNIDPFDIAARQTATSITFYYGLFAGDGTGDARIGTFQCQATLRWVNGPVPPPNTGTGTGALEVGCYETTVTNIFVPATWHPTATGAATRITRVPARIHIFDESNNDDYFYTFGVPNGSPGAPNQQGGINTFDLGSQTGHTMWPHHQYHFTLLLEGAGGQDSPYPGYRNDDSHGNYPEGEFGPYSIDGAPCLTAACVAGIDANIEPGQSASLTGGLSFTNKTHVEYDSENPAAYNIRIDTDGGMGSPPSGPADTDHGIYEHTTDTVRFSFSTSVDSKGSYSWKLLFGGDELDLGQGVPCPGKDVIPATKPTFQVWGGDINTGGGFQVKNASTGAFECTGEYVSPSKSGNPNTAGIKAFGAKDDVYGAYGSLSDFGAMSLGVIARDDSAKIGFNAQPPFSSTTPAGRLYSNPPDYCITNFFEDTQKSPAPEGPGINLTSLIGLGTGQYIVNSSGVPDFKGDTVPAGIRITLYVDGDITITDNIKYANWDVTNPSSSPSLTIIAKGNININRNVTRIDGLYIAQPTSPGQRGIFNDCPDNGSGVACNQIFVVNGAVIARVIKPLRSVGTISKDANPQFSPPPGHNPAEIFNYVPSMIIAPPNFSSIHPNQQGKYNLPPVF